MSAPSGYESPHRDSDRVDVSIVSPVYHAERLSVAGEFHVYDAVSFTFPQKIFHHALFVFRPSMVNNGRLDALRIEAKDCPPNTIDNGTLS
ncbi:MAG: hypothetical protein ACKPB4_22090, partial [Sphaerospermopsis kisseleviana]